MNFPIGSYFAVSFVSYTRRYFLLVAVKEGGCTEIYVGEINFEMRPRVLALGGLLGDWYGMRFRITHDTQQLAVLGNIQLLNGAQIMLLMAPEAALHKDWPKADRLPCSSACHSLLVFWRSCLHISSDIRPEVFIVIFREFLPLQFWELTISIDQVLLVWRLQFLSQSRNPMRFT